MIKITKKGTKAWVTFTLPSTIGKNVEISGEWNDWKNEQMKMKKNGEFYITKLLTTDKNYQFGYSIDNKWKIEKDTKIIGSPFNSENSLLEF